VGYNETSKDYSIFIPLEWKKIMSKYVKFKENLEYRRSKESSMVTKDEEQ
jgi:hypothetical protein